MRILFCTTDFSATRWIFDIAKHIGKAQITAVVNPKFRKAPEPKISIIPFPVSTVGIPSLREAKSAFGNFLNLVRAILEFRPDVFVACDSPDLNIPLALLLRPNLRRTKFIYYIPPPVWIWRSERTPVVRALFDRILCIFPNEVEIWGKKAVWVGHPVAKYVRKVKPRKRRFELCLLLGSREGEVKRHIEVARKLLEILKFRKVVFPTPYPDAVGVGEFEVVSPLDSLKAMAESFAVVGASGTAILEAVMLGKPTVAFYRTDRATLLGGKVLRKLRVIKTDRITLPNILLARDLVPEIIDTDPLWIALKSASALFELDPEEFEKAGRTLLSYLDGMDFDGIARLICEV